jgi:hypothetical protein
MPSPASIAWRRSILAGNDEIWIVMTNSAGSIMSYWVEVPDPVASPQPWSVQQIAGPGSANVPTAALPSHSTRSRRRAGGEGRTSPRMGLTALFTTSLTTGLGGNGTVEMSLARRVQWLA